MVEKTGTTSTLIWIQFEASLKRDQVRLENTPGLLSHNASVTYIVLNESLTAVDE